MTEIADFPHRISDIGEGSSGDTVPFTLKKFEVDNTEKYKSLMHPPNHKTIFLLDHTPYFGANCESLIEFDFTKSRGPGFIPLAPIAKSLWTCSVEAAIEYCRIVWDLFPTGKLVRFIVSDSSAHSLNTWSPTQQSLSHLLNGLASVGVPPSGASSSTSEFAIAHGIQAAVKAMCECSEQQHEKRTSLNENVPPVINRCRVICITSVPNLEGLTDIEETFEQELQQGNKIAISSDLLIPVDFCELVILNIQSNSVESVPSHKVSNMLSSEVHYVKASGGLANKLSSLILPHYDLASTTVTGIPMKEEQNASSSANYDVEIFHSAKAHETLRGCGVEMDQIRTPKEGFDYSTVTLKWCTPRGYTASEMHNCTSMHRITPVDVNSRPSSCLINFLLGGRSVMLEVTRGGGSKALSHLMAAHGGQIYMHSLAIGRSLHEDPPSISEGEGGRVTDYRITDFGLFMQQNKLVPMKGGKTQGSMLKKSRERLERHTKFWPMTISSTVIFNYKQYLEPILTLMLAPELRETDVMQCKQAILALVELEAKHEPLHAASATPGQRGKGPKREEQYRQMWAELESFLRAHCVTDKHINILNCLLEVRSKDSAASLTDKVELDQALRELDQLSSGKSSGSGVGGGANERASVIRATTDSPLSPDATPSQQPTSLHMLHQSSSHLQHVLTKSILELWVARFCRQRPRQEFAGLTTAELLPNGRLRAKLYPLMNKPDKRKPSRPGGGME